MKKALVGIYALGFIGVMGSGVFAQLPNVPVFSMWVTEVSDGQGGPNRCTSCPTQNVPVGEVLPGDVIRVEVYVSTWDAQPGRGICNGDPQQGQNAACTGIGALCPGKHCTNNGSSCATDINCGGAPCVDNTCIAFPRLGAFTATVLGSGLSSGNGGQLSLYEIPCDPADCSFLPDGTCPCAQFYQSPAQCTCASATCSAITDTCSREASGFIERARADYLFFGKSSGEIVGFSFDGTVDFTGFLNNSLADGAVDNGTRKHLGSLILQASANAAGTFTLAFFKDPNATFVVNANAGTFDDMVYQDLILNFMGGGTPDCADILSANPADCEVDGRQPHDIGNTSPAQGITSIDVTLSAPCNNIGALTPAAFSLSVTPAGGTPPTITNVSGAGNTATLTLSGPIPPQKWTCISRTGGANSTCVGFLPGDVNANLAANTADVTAAIGSLTGMVPEPLIGTDTNRSTIHTAEDLVRLLDLFNGGGAYSPLLNTTLPACP